MRERAMRERAMRERYRRACYQEGRGREKEKETDMSERVETRATEGNVACRRRGEERWRELRGRAPWRAR